MLDRTALIHEAMMAVSYDNDERRLIQEAQNAAETMADTILVEEFADDLLEAIALNQEFVASIARQRLKEFIKKRTP
jgi:hypothetical protein